MALLQDISEQKRLEEEISKVKKLAETANNEKAHFLAMMGHELRTPLNAIVGFSEMMENGIGGELAPKHKEYTQLISQSGHHLVAVVNSILDMSKIKAGKFELDLNNFNPQDLISQSLHMVSKEANEKNIIIKVNKDKHFPDIKADQRACLQIIINLLSNAIKFSKDGALVTLSLNLRGRSLKIEVKDNGIGMSNQLIARLGEPFLQADRGVARNYEGTGLGISIVKGLVALHQGSFSVQSTLNIGTNISILLPMKGPKTQDEQSAKINSKTIVPFDVRKQQSKPFKQHLLEVELKNKRAAQ